MSEESKNDSDYVKMGEGPGLNRGIDALKLDDPNLSQEDKDMRLAIALQQQENAAAYDAHKKKHEAAIAAQKNRTTRSGAHGKLAAIRDKDQGMLSVPPAYTTENAYVSGGDEKYLPPIGDKTILKGASPQEVADHNLASTLQKVEQIGAGTAAETVKIIREETGDDEAQKRRTERSNFHINQKGLRLG
eukprot:CAMPEP_0116576064 /NCGR_PEP_ID=MMETSP0397-20121206/20304_1 /TAXON_ID=216820 /ORGANISM="Cyclophora tenuis, Strain ECT3854" /LENGTH=188 /DNA_ID=CAMNT_0004105023 /DNA_START=10 /DNA_END=576 /DNA_ORIENTATION=-